MKALLHRPVYRSYTDQLRPFAAQLGGICAEGGGKNGLAYVQPLKYLECAEAKPHSFSGASAGALLALQLALGRTSEDIHRTLLETRWSEFARYRPGATLRLLLTGGWHSLEYARAWIAGILSEAGFSERLTFEELLSYKKTELYVSVTRYVAFGEWRSSESLLMSANTTPKARVAQAVLASMAVPYFWPPVAVDFGDGVWHCADGGVGNNQPFAEHHKASGLPLGSILGLRVDQQQEVARDSGELKAEPYRPGFGDIAVALFNGVREAANATHVPKEYWPYMCQIDVGDSSALDFDFNGAAALNLIDSGQRSFEEWIRRWYFEDWSRRSAEKEKT